MSWARGSGSAATPQPDRTPWRPVPGARFDHYTLVALLGQGGMGVVYRARDERLGRDVALKVVSGTGGDTAKRGARFLREIEAASRVSHPNVVKVHGTGEANGLRLQTSGSEWQIRRIRAGRDR